MVLGILLTGGDEEYGVETHFLSVELLNDDGSPFCLLPSLPSEYPLRQHTQTSLVACGGGKINSIQNAHCTMGICAAKFGPS